MIIETRWVGLLLGNEAEDLLERGVRELSELMGIFWLDKGVDSISVLICQTEQTIHLRSVHFIECKVELTKNFEKVFQISPLLLIILIQAVNIPHLFCCNNQKIL